MKHMNNPTKTLIKPFLTRDIWGPPYFIVPFWVTYIIHYGEEKGFIF